MDSANSQCVISVLDRFQNGSPTTDVTASRSGSAATARLIGTRLGFCLLALALPAAAQWRTGYFMQAEAAGQTAATIPWSKYTHVIHYDITFMRAQYAPALQLCRLTKRQQRPMSS